MGLLDYLFDPGTYGGSGGLLSQLQPAMDPSFAQRFQPAMDQPLAAPPTFSQRFQPAADNPLVSMAGNINVGGYSMPRIGNPSDYASQPSINAQAAIPPNAQPTQGQLPPDQVAPQQLPPALGGANMGGNFGAGLQSLVNTPGGLLPKLLGGATGLLTGQRSDPAGMQQQNLKSQYDSLVPLLGPQKALLAVMNPEAGKTLIGEALTNKEKYQVVSEDPLEGKKYGFVNEREQTVNGQPITSGNASPASGQGSLAALSQARQAGVTGDALYEYLPPQYRSTVKAMIEGRQPLPSTTAMRSPATLALIDAAHSIDPTFDATVWKARNEAGPDWTKGKSSEMVRAANQTLAHVGSLMDAMDKLGNTRFPAANYVKNFANEATGGGEPGSFRTNAHAVAEEMSKVFKGANLSDSEIRHWEQNLSENMSPEQQRAQIAKLSELLHGSLQALEEKRLTAMGPTMAEKQGPLIKAEGQRVLERIDNWVKSNGVQPAAPANSSLPQGWSVKVR